MVSDLIALLDQADGQSFEPPALSGLVLGFQKIKQTPQGGQIAWPTPHEQNVELEFLAVDVRTSGLSRKIVHGLLQEPANRQV